jgi:hypothetical protein
VQHCEEAAVLKTAIARTDITPRESVPLMGYGDRTHDSEGVHDPLYAYAWWLEADDEKPIVWIVFDLCLMSVASVRHLAQQISARTGVDHDRIFLSTTHTHSGPDTVSIGSDDRPWARRYQELLVDAGARVVREARDRALPGRIEVRTGRSALGVNRRNPQAPIDPRIVLLALVDEAGRERGMLFHYSCHLTVLGVDNYRISADWLGPVRERLERQLGFPVMYLQGAEGNVDPVSRGALDMADPEQAAGASFEVLGELAGEMIGAIRRARESQVQAVVEDLQVSARSIEMPLRYGGLSPAQLRAKVGEWKERFADFLECPAEQVPEDWSINARIKEQARRRNLDEGQTRRWVSEQFTYTSFLDVYRVGADSSDAERGEIPAAVTLLDFGVLRILGVPMEVLLEVAFDWQRRLDGSIALICSLFGGWIGYLPHPCNHREPRAGQLYETVSTMFAPDAALRLLEAGEGMIARRG